MLLRGVVHYHIMLQALHACRRRWAADLQGRETVQAYLRECREVGFDVVELSARFGTMPGGDLLRLVADARRVRRPLPSLCACRNTPLEAASVAFVTAGGNLWLRHRVSRVLMKR